MKKFAFILFFLPATGALASGNISDLFAALDKDGNGALSKEEASAESRLAAAFDEIDSDGDGQISRAEFDKYQSN
ncbi:EF-hand domain-containing protein [Bowmanella yangjiangensis]|uniref:EF-hand domain-containing protein n=1 Tax=Bowmanella yangjiangensis TaxID=2811230 RepID=A0ABS3CND7_9ALTE|nr:EF-hand domain-containing protein [Bowmanella yangjiangensis]MBN7818614.1 EF-hand domain-containing protein [Bowmanella yangjiangensis]